MKIRPLWAELFHADGQTFNTKLIVAFRNFTNAPKNVIQYFEKWIHYADDNKIA